MLDAVTEYISHFIGYFHVSTEGARLRLEYDRFRHEKAEQSDPAPHEPQPPETTSHDLEGYDPGLSWRPKFKPLEELEGPSAAPSPNPFPDAPVDVPIAERPESALPPVVAWVAPGWPAEPPPAEPPPASEPGPVPALPVPSSVATVTVQVVTLADDDVIGDVAGAGFAPPESLAPRLDQLVEVATTIEAVALPQPGGEAPWVGVAAALKAQVAEAAAGAPAEAAPEGAEMFTAVGATATGVLVDGAAASEMPKLADHMPAFLADAEDPDGDEGPHGDTDGEAEEGAQGSAEGAGPKDFPEGYEAPAPQLSGHVVVAGANAVVNEAVVTTAWLDARVIAVKGDVTQIAAISQSNVLSDVDDLGDDLRVQPAPEVPSELLNAARIDRIAAPDVVEAAVAKLPSSWAVTRIEGDLVEFNWVKQLTFVTDHDRAQVTTTGSNTWIGLGENEVANATVIAEVGYRFDLILVGGNLYDVAAVTQRNVLLDDDRVAGGGIASGGDNHLFNSAAIEAKGVDTFESLSATFEGVIDAVAEGAASMAGVAADALFQGLEAMRVLYVAGDLIKMNVVEQVNVVGDSDQVELALRDAAAAAEIEVVTGSNLLANLATIRDVGVDSTVMAGGEVYTDALIHQAGFVSPEAPSLGASLPPLASEAVAFLADGLIDAPDAADAAPGGPPMDGGSFDVLQTMLA